MNKTKSGKGFIIAGVIIIVFFILGLTNNIAHGRNLGKIIFGGIILCILGAVLIFIGYSRAKKAKNNANAQYMQGMPNMQNFQNMNNQYAQTNANANGFCSKCGNPLNGEPFCSKCGSPANH
jgi:Na+/melibiose symporter-like transporter